MASDDRKGAALAFMQRASRDTFRLCAQSAEAMAAQIESGELPMDAANALRLRR
jgi:exonuclease VII small subunit